MYTDISYTQWIVFIISLVFSVPAIESTAAETPAPVLIEIPLQEVPFYSDPRGYFLKGFDVDSVGNFYFMSSGYLASPTRVYPALTKFSPDLEKGYEKKYNFHSSPIHYWGTELYVFDWVRTKGIIVIDPHNGEIQEVIPDLFDFFSPIYLSFHDSLLFFAEPGIANYIYLLPERKIIGTAPNLYGLPRDIYQRIRPREPVPYKDVYGITYLGNWRDYVVLWGVYDFNHPTHREKLWLETANGEEILSIIIPKQQLTEVFVEDTDEMRLFKYGKFYRVYHDEKNIIIAVYNIAERIENKME